MNLEDLVDESGLQQDQWSLSKPKFGSEGQLEVVGWSGKRLTHKLYILSCNLCSNDAELFGAGYFKSSKNGLMAGQLPCGCSRAPRWTKSQYKTLCSRKAEELGHTFAEFVGEWRWAKTKIKMLCKEHGEWSTGSISSLINSIGCPYCGYSNMRQSKMKDDEVMISSFLNSNAFHPETKFWRSERVASNSVKAYWYMSCPECGEQGESTSGDLQKGCRPCACTNMRQRECYINLVKNALNNPIALKFGVANNSASRVKRQNQKSTYVIESHLVYQFSDVTSCKKAERDCKQELECAILTQEEMPDGYTETTWVYNLEKIIEIYQRNGGIRQENP